jgi:hypothetical protein
MKLLRTTALTAALMTARCSQVRLRLGVGAGEVADGAGAEREWVLQPEH